jgi:hypothetical protein
LRPRIILGLGMIVLGILLVAVSIGSMVVRYTSSLNLTLLGGLGALVLFIGALLLITELLETWLSRGQAALVDGLQAG